MKVCFPIKNKRSGSGLFLHRLACALKGLGVQIVNDPMARPDVSVSPITLRKTNSKRHILRLDGIYHDVCTNYKGRNKALIDSLHRADGVVYQGEFSKKLCDKYLGVVDKKYRLIRNGMDLNYHTSVSPAKKEHKHNFLTASSWRPQKRLVDMMESFLLADISDSMLYVAGGVYKKTVSMDTLNKYFKEPRIKYLGHLSQHQLTSYLRIVNGFIHLSWIDWCPNCVVEAIAARVPVITNNVGGTQELVRPSGGFVLSLDEPYDLSPCRLYEPPEINQEIVAEALRRCCKGNIRIKNSHVDIDIAALKYKNFFESLLS